MLRGNEILDLQVNQWGNLTTEDGIRNPELRQLLITPFDPCRINPNSYNMTLNSELLVYRENIKWVLSKSPQSAEFVATFIQPYSQLNDFTLLWDSPSVYDVAKEPLYIRLQIPESGIVLHPDLLYIGATNEVTKCVNLVPAIEGRSSVARAGVSVHQTAGFGDNGYHGAWTLEISCLFPVRIYEGSEICQICFHEMSGELGPLYKGKYQGSSGPKATGWWKDFKKNNQ